MAMANKINKMPITIKKIFKILVKLKSESVERVFETVTEELGIVVEL